MLSTAKLDGLFSVIVDRKYLIPSVYLSPNASRFLPPVQLKSPPITFPRGSRLVLHSLALGHQGFSLINVR